MLPVGYAYTYTHSVLTTIFPDEPQLAGPVAHFTLLLHLFLDYPFGTGLNFPCDS